MSSKIRSTCKRGLTRVLDQLHQAYHNRETSPHPEEHRILVSSCVVTRMFEVLTAMSTCNFASADTRDHAVVSCNSSVDGTCQLVCGS